MCKTAKDIWQSLLITHQGNSQVKDNKIDLLVQQYEQFTILEEESIDSGFARFNTIITSLKALDEGFSSKNYVRKFLRALHPKWRAKVTAIEESKDLSSLALDELIDNLKVHEVVMEKDSKIYRGKNKRIKSIALKAKKESSNDETSTSGSDDEEYVMAVRNFKKFFRRKGKFVRQPREEKKSFRQRDEKKGKTDRKCFRCSDPNHLIGDCPKPSRNKDQQAFIGGSWSDSENDTEDKTNDETCLMAQSSNEVCLRTCLELDEWIKDSGCTKHMTGNKSLFSTYKAYDGEHVDNLAFNLLSVGQICDNKCQVLFTEEGSEIIKDGKIIGNGIRKNGLYIMKLGKSQDKLCLTTVVDNSTLWHRRLGHANMSLIQSLLTPQLHESAGGLPSLKLSLHSCSLPGSTNAMGIETSIALVLPAREHECDTRSVFADFSTKDYLTKFDLKSYEGVFLGYSQDSKAYVVLNKHTMKVNESVNVTFDESPPPTKLSPLVDDDVGEEEAIKRNTKVVNNNNEEDESIEVDEIVNIKESKNHPLDQVIGNINQRTLRSQAQNHSNFFCFISTIEPKDVKEALKDKSWVVAMQEELNQFVANDVWELVPLPISQSVIGTKWVFRNNIDENGIVSRNKARLVAQRYNQHEGIDYDETLSSVARL
ncbi:retrovirus-related pol polyprotein from transposon TNT 1-94 [Tanacetum coccineum]